MREPSASAEAAGRILDAVGVPWALAGALAALRYRATPRLTVDADILAHPDPVIEEAFVAEGYTVEAKADVGEAPHLLLVRGHGDVVDILLAATEYQHTALARAVDHVLTVEDVIVHKLIAWRPRDRSDIASILDTRPSLDVDYIEGWAGAWAVADRWAQAVDGRL